MAKMNKEELVKAIEEMTMLELNDVVKALEEKFGVSAMAMSAPAASATPASGGEAASDAEEKTSFDVELTEAGASKISVIKAVREINSSLGLSEAKTLVESAPKMILEGVKKEPADEAKKKLEAAGAKVTLK